MDINANMNDPNAQLQAARELLTTTKRNLQLVDAQLQILQGGRVGVQSADDVSSEHRAMWQGAVDANDGSNGILIGSGDLATSFGFNNPKYGIIKNQEDAAFVCTSILVAQGFATEDSDQDVTTIVEDGDGAAGDVSLGDNYLLRLTDGNTGRSLIAGMSTGTVVAGMTLPPIDLDRGVVPFSYISSFRGGRGADYKNKLFSEFTIPRAGNVRATVYNMGVWRNDNTRIMRVYVSLLGYKVFGA